MNPQIITAAENLVALLKAEAGTPTPPAQPPAPVPEGFVYLPKTGNLLPKPEPQHNALAGYLPEVALEMQWATTYPPFRVSNEALALYAGNHGVDAKNVQALSALHAKRELWPEMVDQYYNRAAYGVSEPVTPVNVTLADSYSSAGALVAAANAGYLYVVKLDGVVINGDNKFGPPDQYWTQPNGTVSTSRPSTPTLPGVG